MYHIVSMFLCVSGSKESSSIFDDSSPPRKNDLIIEGGKILELIGLHVEMIAQPFQNIKTPISK